MSRNSLKLHSADRVGSDFRSRQLEHATQNAPFSNFSGDVPLNINEICDSVFGRTGDWPKCIGGSLSYEEDGKIKPLANVAALFAWIGGFGPIEWRNSPKAPTKEEFFQRLHQLESYEWATPHPHFPEVPGVLYLAQPPKAKRTGALDKLLDYFSPRTEHDRELIRALFLTTVWGGPAAARPQFVIAADEGGDDDAGRGIGKTTLAQFAASLVGGCIDVDPTSSHDRTLSNLLSPEAFNRRVALTDNLKTARFSSEFLEKLITRTELTGHRLYRGFAKRTNLLTWIVTVNGASFSTDMAQRSVVIMLERPRSSGQNWASKVRSFIQKKQQDLLADMRYLLEKEQGKELPSFRWSEWSEGVLSRCNHPEDVLMCIKDRQQGIDADKDEVNQAIEHLARCIGAYLQRKNPNWDSEDPILLAHSVRARAPSAWLVEALTSLRTDMSHRTAQLFLKRLTGTGLLSLAPTKEHRGYMWTGEQAKGERDGLRQIYTIEYQPRTR